MQAEKRAGCDHGAQHIAATAGRVAMAEKHWRSADRDVDNSFD
jgi:hypothetical protein